MYRYMVCIPQGFKNQILVNFPKLQPFLDGQDVLLVPNEERTNLQGACEKNDTFILAKEA